MAERFSLSHIFKEPLIKEYVTDPKPEDGGQTGEDDPEAVLGLDGMGAIDPERTFADAAAAYAAGDELSAEYLLQQGQSELQGMIPEGDGHDGKISPGGLANL